MVMCIYSKLCQEHDQQDWYKHCIVAGINKVKYTIQSYKLYKDMISKSYVADISHLSDISLVCLHLPCTVMPIHSHVKPFSVNLTLYLSPLLPIIGQLVPIAQWFLKLISLGDKNFSLNFLFDITISPSLK